MLERNKKKMICESSNIYDNNNEKVVSGHAQRIWCDGRELVICTSGLEFKSVRVPLIRVWTIEVLLAHLSS